MIAFIVLYQFLLVLSAEAQTRYASNPSPSMPMFVKTPYLNAWLPYTNSSAEPGTVSPIFYADWNIGYTGLIRVDGQTYRWMGTASLDNVSTPAETITQYISPTSTVLVMKAGEVQLNVTWLSPIEPEDWAKQSFPFAYCYIDIATLDGKAHSIQLYTDVTGEWVAHDNSTIITWDTSETDTISYHQLKIQEQQYLQDPDGMARDLTLYFIATKEFDISWQIGANSSIPQDRFITNGSLDNSKNTNFRAINDGFPALSFSYDLSTISSTQKPVVWAIGAVRNPAIKYVVGSNTQLRSASYWSKANLLSDSMDDFIADFPNAIARADSLDRKIMSDGLAISSDYADLLALCLRQTMAGFDITIAKDNNGNWNETDVKIFTKNPGAEVLRSNAVEPVHAAFPALLYLNVSLAGCILSPMLELQVDFEGFSLSVGDLGQIYPNVTGSTTLDLSQAITNNGDMLFMIAAHAKKSGDTTLISKYYNMLKRWADFLVSFCLYPGSQYTTSNDINYANMSNLALQGIVGIHAMSIIAEILGKADDTQMYSINASALLRQWQTLAFDGDHLITAYGTPSSWSLMYNLYGARMLGLAVDQRILDAHSQFYELQATNAPQFGFPVTVEGSVVISYWNLFTAATTTTTASRDVLISQIHERFFSNNTVDFPFPSKYDKNTGASDGYPGGRSSPMMGSAFALLALNIPDKIITGPTNSTNTNNTTSGKSNTAIIVGATIGSMVGFIALSFGVFFLYQRCNPQAYREARNQVIATPFEFPVEIRKERLAMRGSTDNRRNVPFNTMYMQLEMRNAQMNGFQKESNNYRSRSGSHSNLNTYGLSS